jgi:type II secretory pathway pseudopilin PulG
MQIFRKQLKTAMTLVETLAVITILGIVLFITLPHLTNSKTTNDLAAAKAKIAQLNAAKDAYISLIGITPAQNNWNTAANTNGRFALIKNLIRPNTSAANMGAFTVPGYSYSFENQIASPTILWNYAVPPTGKMAY